MVVKADEGRDCTKKKVQWHRVQSGGSWPSCVIFISCSMNLILAALFSGVLIRHSRAGASVENDYNTQAGNHLYHYQYLTALIVLSKTLLICDIALCFRFAQHIKFRRGRREMVWPPCATQGVPSPQRPSAWHRPQSPAHPGTLAQGQLHLDAGGFHFSCIWYAAWCQACSCWGAWAQPWTCSLTWTQTPSWCGELT